MKKLKYLNICYDLKENNEEFYNYLSSYTNNLFKYDNQDELIELINTKEIHLVVTKYNFEILKEIRSLNNQIQIVAFLDELNIDYIKSDVSKRKDKIKSIARKIVKKSISYLRF